MVLQTPVPFFVAFQSLEGSAGGGAVFFSGSWTDGGEGPCGDLARAFLTSNSSDVVQAGVSSVSAAVVLAQAGANSNANTLRFHFFSFLTPLSCLWTHIPLMS